MQELTIRFGRFSYPYLLGSRCIDAIAERIRALDADAYFVVADDTVAELHAAPLVRALGCAQLLRCPAGEAEKRLATLGELCESALAMGMTRRSCVVAMGGGIVGNIAGLMAALCFRGVRLVHVPTTTVSMFDGVLSLKQAINAKMGKNLIGAFHCPTLVLADTALLQTLPERERRSGICELIKNAMAIAPDTVELLQRVLNERCEFSDDEYREFARIAVAAKLQVMADDEYEKREGIVLEYGHTFGHAVEFCSRGALTHGESVGIGIALAARVSAKLHRLDENAVALHDELLERCGASVRMPRTVDVAEVLRCVLFDNKRGYLQARQSGEVDMVLLSRLGEVIRTGTLPLHPVPIAMLEDVVGR